MRFTVLIPTFNNGELIRPAIESVLAQSVTDFELIVVADGAPPSTHAIVQEYAQRDARIELRIHEKAERHGERLRHEAITHATTDAACYLSDDDFWFPDHLATMADLLSRADFAHTRHVEILPSLRLLGQMGNLSDPRIRAAMLTPIPLDNFIGLTVAGHRLDAYRRLPEGWTPAPHDLPTDLHMWRKWIRCEGMRLASSTRITSLHFSRFARQGMPPTMVDNEPRVWYEAFAAPHMREALERACPASQEVFSLASVFLAARAILAEREESRHAEALGLTRSIEERDREIFRLRNELQREAADAATARQRGDALSERIVELSAQLVALSRAIATPGEVGISQRGGSTRGRE